LHPTVLNSILTSEIGKLQKKFSLKTNK